MCYVNVEQSEIIISLWYYSSNSVKIVIVIKCYNVFIIYQSSIGLFSEGLFDFDWISSQCNIKRIKDKIIWEDIILMFGKVFIERY